MTLYTFDADIQTPNASACSGGCAVLWPPVPAPAGFTASGSWSIIARADGTQELAYKGSPLYTYANDAKAGDVTGDGVLSFGAKWHLAMP
jgi:predicted lipoprotein with Yx(FWY)xxD motif